MIRFPSKTNSLRFLRQAGLPVETVLDVGAHKETIELIKLTLPDKRHILFELACEFHPELHRNYAGMPTILRSSDGAILIDYRELLHKVAIDGGAISHSMLVDHDYAGRTEQVSAIRGFDTFMKGSKEPKPYLLKIDVDGYEIPIVRGSEKTLEDVSCLIVEAPVANFAERLQLILSRGFHLFEIVDICYYFGVLAQVVLIFVSNNVMQLPSLRPWETRQFSWQEWVPVNNFESAIQQLNAVSKE